MTPDLSRPPTGDAGTIDWATIAKDARFTESRADLVHLYDIARLGQLNDAFMRELDPDELVFLAAHDPAVASFELDMEIQRGKLDTMLKGKEAYRTEVQKLHDLAAMKNNLEQNARRARLEIDRRRERATRWWTVGAVLVAAAIGAAAAIVAAVVS